MAPFFVKQCRRVWSDTTDENVLFTLIVIFAFTIGVLIGQRYTVLDYVNRTVFRRFGLKQQKERRTGKMPDLSCESIPNALEESTPLSPVSTITDNETDISSQPSQPELFDRYRHMAMSPKRCSSTKSEDQSYEILGSEATSSSSSKYDPAKYFAAMDRSLARLASNSLHSPSSKKWFTSSPLVVNTAFASSMYSNHGGSNSPCSPVSLACANTIIVSHHKRSVLSSLSAKESSSTREDVNTLTSGVSSRSIPAMNPIRENDEEDDSRCKDIERHHGSLRNSRMYNQPQPHNRVATDRNLSEDQRSQSSQNSYRSQHSQRSEHQSTAAPDCDNAHGNFPACRRLDNGSVTPTRPHLDRCRSAPLPKSPSLKNIFPPVVSPEKKVAIARSRTTSAESTDSQSPFQYCDTLTECSEPSDAPACGSRLKQQQLHLRQHHRVDSNFNVIRAQRADQIHLTAHSGQTVIQEVIHRNCAVVSEVQHDDGQSAS